MNRPLLAAVALSIASLGFVAAPATAESYGHEVAGKGVKVTIDEECGGDGWVRVVGPINTPRGTVRVCQKGLN